MDSVYFLRDCSSHQDTAAMRALLEALREDPRNPTALCRLGYLTLRHDIDRAEGHFRTAVNGVVDPVVWYCLATIDYARGNGRTATERTEEALPHVNGEGDCLRGDLHWLAAQPHIDANERDAAMEHLKRGAQAYRAHLQAVPTTELGSHASSLAKDRMLIASSIDL